MLGAYFVSTSISRVPYERTTGGRRTMVYYDRHIAFLQYKESFASVSDHMHLNKR